MNCEECREALEEHFAVAGAAALVPVWCERHLNQCQDCRLFVAEERELNRLLEEPLALPPADLSQRIMQAVGRQSLEVSVPLAERLLWAVAGGACVAVYQYLPLDILSDLWNMSWSYNLDLPEWTFTLPDTGSLLLPAAALLTVLQIGTMVWIRKRATT